MPRYFLIFNVGSTSIKSRLFNQQLQVQTTLNIDYTAATGLILSGSDAQGERIQEKLGDDFAIDVALRTLLAHWQAIALSQHWQVSAIGHRVVHGGAEFKTITPLTPAVIASITELDHYAPLHNPLNRLGISLAVHYFPDVPQFAVFDTAFHRQIPEYAGRYAIPDNLSKAVVFYRYGFHGISCQHSVTAAAQLLSTDQTKLNLIILHLGGGASVTAVKNGVSVDTSMGFSPTEGLMMASRCGDLDSMIPLTLQREGYSCDEVDELINHRSGLLGVCGSTDMRLVLKNVEQQQAESVLALEMYCYRIKKYIGAYVAVLGEVAAIIFTGGIGEHTPMVREKILAGLGPLGFILNPFLNAAAINIDREISAAHSRSRVLVIPAAEELEIARQLLAVVDGDSKIN